MLDCHGCCGVKSVGAHLAVEQVERTPRVGAGVPLLADQAPDLRQDPLRAAGVDLDLVPEAQRLARRVHLPQLEVAPSVPVPVPLQLLMTPEGRQSMQDMAFTFMVTMVHQQYGGGIPW